jgi:hypothetical protein
MNELVLIKTASDVTNQSEYYRVAQPIVNGKRVASLFMITSEKQHQAAKRPIANAYSMTTLLD